MNTLSTYRFVISGGGTGGHIFPAIAVAKELQSRLEEVSIHFVGALGKMEMEKVPQAGFEITGLPIAGIQRKLSLKNLLFPFKLIRSIEQAKGVLKKHQPHAVIGFGGYASAPVLYAAKNKGIPIVIQEQNAFAGLANKWLSKYASKICVAHEGMEAFFPKDKLHITGNPVRQDIFILPQRNASIQGFGLSPEKQTILILGGSLGARMMNKSVEAGISRLVSSGYNVIWQCGKFYYDEYKSYEERYSEQVRVTPFISEMNKAYAAADMIVSRSGALAMAELCLVGKPVIFVPSANVAEDHQTRNALSLVNMEAALMISDHEAIAKLTEVLLKLGNDRALKATLSYNIKKAAKPDATKNIVNEIMALIK